MSSTSARKGEATRPQMHCNLSWLESKLSTHDLEKTCKSLLKNPLLSIFPQVLGATACRLRFIVGTPAHRKYHPQPGSSPRPIQWEGRLRPTASTMQPPTKIEFCVYILESTSKWRRWSLDNGTHLHPQHGLRLSQDSTALGAVVSWALPCNTGTFCSILSMLYRHQ